MVCQATSHFSVSQCDFTSTIGIGPGWPSPADVGVSCPAQGLLPQQRQNLAIQAFAGTETVSALARQHEVSRKFLDQLELSGKLESVLSRMTETLKWGALRRRR
jgi:hypothetical protein